VKTIAKLFLITTISGLSASYAADKRNSQTDSTDVNRRLQSIEKTVSQLDTQIEEVSKLLLQQSQILQKLSTSQSAQRPPSREDAVKSLIGKTVPFANLSYLAVDGKKSPVDLAGRDTIVLTVMRTGCHFCQEETPVLAALDAEKSATASVLPVFAPEDPAAIARFLADRGWKDAQPLVITGSLDVPITGTPTTLVVDKTGKVTKAFVGRLAPTDVAEIRKLIVNPGEKEKSE
jgi:thiol-disulfide isomerase/thioredoxin